MTHHTIREAPATEHGFQAHRGTRALGTRPPKNAPALTLSIEGGTLTGVVPDAPAAVDHFAGIRAWHLGGNDRFGTCGPVSVANQRRLVTGYLTTQAGWYADEKIYDLYRRSGNPGFDPATGADDNGVDMQTMCEALLSGGFAGVKPVCFAKIDVSRIQDLRAAEAIFGSVLLGVTLDETQNAQTDAGLWEYQPSPVWGGHAVMSGRYQDRVDDTQDRTGVITWAMTVDTTDAFLQYQLDEAWVVIWPEQLGTQEFQQGVNLDVLAADYTALTGRPFPVAPTPAPGMPTVVDLELARSLHDWLDHPGRFGRTAALRRAGRAWLEQEGL
jgi:hypothetical protein